MKLKSFVFSFLLCAAAGGGYAQTQEAAKTEPKKEIEELRLKLNEDGSHYIKATFLNQVWLRSDQSNPNTNVLAQSAPRTVDIGLRRTRFVMQGQLTDHVLFYFQIGQNNFNFLANNAGNRKMQLFIHDALAEYKIKKHSDLLYVGYGLTLANGLSRFSQPSIGTIMSLDVPVFAQATVDQTDEFSRKLSLYARGQVGRFDYRLVMSDPFPINTNGTSGINGAIPVNPNTNITYPASTTVSAFAQAGHHKQYQGFFMWNFFDKESHTTPYMTGTYLGKKKVLNLEGGFITQKNATWTETTTGLASATNTTYHSMKLWSIAAFFDTPLNTETGTAFNAYLGYFHTDYGKGYLRYNGIMNPASSSSVANQQSVGSFGNAFPMFGNGNVVYAQAGYLLKRDLFGEGNGTLMPYITYQSAKYDRLDKQMQVVDVGVNWLIKGHTSKITLDYQNRPAYSSSTTTGDTFALTRRSERYSQLNLQYQIYF